MHYVAVIIIIISSSGASELISLRARVSVHAIRKCSILNLHRFMTYLSILCIVMNSISMDTCTLTHHYCYLKSLCTSAKHHMSAFVLSTILTAPSRGLVLR